MIKNSEFTYRGVAASALILAFALHTTHVSAAETCVSAPTCAELGYTLTSTTNCVGTALKCPFDASKFYCTSISEIATTLMPDYSTRYKLSNNITYTVGSGALSSFKCLWVMFYSGGEAIDAANNYTEWFINGHVVGASATIITDYIMGFYPVYAGDTFKLKAAMRNGNDHLHYFPCKKRN